MAEGGITAPAQPTSRPEAMVGWDLSPVPLPKALLERYLDRLTLGRPAEPTLSALAEIQWAHLAAFPFENFDALLGRPIGLGHETMVAKMVDGQRGGYCFEQNVLLAAALTAVGYPVRLLLGRGLVGADAPRPRTHLALLVGLPDGAERLVDVGFGRTSLRGPLELAPGLTQRLGTDEYRVDSYDGELAVRTRRPGALDWWTLYLLDPRPVYPVDVEMANHWVATHSQSHMKQRAIVLRPTAAGKRSLAGRRLVVDEGPRQVDRELGHSELGGVLREEFGIVLPEPLADLPA